LRLGQQHLYAVGHGRLQRDSPVRNLCAWHVAASCADIAGCAPFFKPTSRVLSVPTRHTQNPFACLLCAAPAIGNPTWPRAIRLMGKWLKEKRIGAEHWLASSTSRRFNPTSISFSVILTRASGSAIRNAPHRQCDHSSSSAKN
jgi:hypothetical protein